MVQLSCSTLCNELLQHCGAGAVCLCWVLSCLAGLCGEGRAEGTIKNTGGVKACPTGSWLVSQPTSSPVTWCSMGCHAPVTHPALWKRVPCGPGAVQGFLYQPGLWEVMSGSARPSSPVPPSAGNCVPSAGGAGWGGLSMPGQHQHSSLTALCKPSWGRFLLRFLPPAVLPALGWRQRPPPGCTVGLWAEGMEAVAGTAT